MGRLGPPAALRGLPAISGSDGPASRRAARLTGRANPPHEMGPYQRDLVSNTTIKKLHEFFDHAASRRVEIDAPALTWLDQ